MDRTISHIQRGYGLPDGICVLSYSHPQVEALKTQLTATIAALEPFATYMQSGGDKDYNGQPVPDEQGVGWIYLNHGHFRKAHAAWEARPK